MLLFIKDKTAGHHSHFQQHAVLHLCTYTPEKLHQYTYAPEKWTVSPSAVEQQRNWTVPSLRPHLRLLLKVTLNVFSCFLPCFRLNCSAISKAASSILTNTIKQTVDPQEVTTASLLKTTSLFICLKKHLYGVVVAHRIWNEWLCVDFQQEQGYTAFTQNLNVNILKLGRLDTLPKFHRL